MAPGRKYIWLYLLLWGCANERHIVTSIAQLKAAKNMTNVLTQASSNFLHLLDGVSNDKLLQYYIGKNKNQNLSRALILKSVIIKGY